VNRRIVAALGGIAIAVLSPAGDALAHASLDGSSPSSGAVVSESPDQLVLEFDEAVTLDLGGIELADSDGAGIDIPNGVVDRGRPSIVTVEGVPALGDGVYVVVWSVSSSDGHPARGAFTFRVGRAGDSLDDEALIASALAGRGAGPAVSWVLGAGRFIAFGGAVLLIGAVVVHLLSGDVRPRRRARALWWSAWVAGAAGTALVFVLQGPYLSGGSLADAFDPSLWPDVADTRVGRALLARLIVFGVVLVWLRRATSVPPTWWWWSLWSLVLVATFSVAGHPSAASPAALGVALDAVHLVGVSLWLGGLAGVLVASPPAERVTLRFSSLATVAVPVIVVTGGWQTWHLLGGIDDFADLTATDWGRTLLAKLALVVVLVTLGAISRWLIRADGPGAVRRLVVTELVVGGLVLALTAGLVATPPTPPPASQVFSITLVQGSLLADVSLTPGRVGSNEIHVVFTPPGGSLQPVRSVEARLRSPDLPAVPVLLTEDGPNHYIGDVQIPRAGDWILDLEVEPQPNSTVLLSTPVTIPG
jgi:copper transport protein